MSETLTPGAPRQGSVCQTLLGAGPWETPNLTSQKQINQLRCDFLCVCEKLASTGVTSSVGASVGRGAPNHQTLSPWRVAWGRICGHCSQCAEGMRGGFCAECTSVLMHGGAGSASRSRCQWDLNPECAVGSMGRLLSHTALCVGCHCHLLQMEKLRLCRWTPCPPCPGQGGEAWNLTSGWRP